MGLLLSALAMLLSFLPGGAGPAISATAPLLTAMGASASLVAAVPASVPAAPLASGRR